MSESGGWVAGRLVEVDEAECWTLLGSVPVGRLAWHGADGLTVVPVNFVVADRDIRVHTAPYTLLARECDDAPVAFQVDEVDPFTRSGWSVLVRGTAHIDFGSGHAETVEPDVWPGGAKPLHVVVPVDSISGRRLLPS
jgi:uncharacterized protein